MYLNKMKKKVITAGMGKIVFLKWFFIFINMTREE